MPGSALNSSISTYDNWERKAAKRSQVVDLRRKLEGKRSEVEEQSRQAADQATEQNDESEIIAPGTDNRTIYEGTGTVRVRYRLWVGRKTGTEPRIFGFKTLCAESTFIS